MKYLVNRKTKEHRIHNYGEEHRLGSVHGDWKVIEADPEGWIKHDGSECPLPDDVKCQLWLKRPDKASIISEARSWAWGADNFTKYRPILDDEPTVKESLSVDIITRLQSAHKAANELPDIIQELREVLEPMGYDLVARSPFVEAEPEPDMTDWRNWMEGDKIVALRGDSFFLTKGRTYTIIEFDIDGDPRFIGDDNNNHVEYAKHFRFHSRPTKEQNK